MYTLDILNLVVSVSYLIISVLYARYFLWQEQNIGRWLTPALWLVFLLYLGEIILRGIFSGHFPLATIYEAASVIAISITIIYVYIEYRLGVKTTGIFILPVAMGFQVYSSIYAIFAAGNIVTPPKILQNPYFILHAPSAILGYCVLLVASIYSLMYLLLFYDIKSSRFGVVYSRLPSLEILQEMNLKAVMMGLLFLSITIITGIFWLGSSHGVKGNLDPVVFSVYVLWIIYAAEILGHKFASWSGKRLAYLSLTGFVLIFVSMLSVHLLFPAFHKFR